jgi:C-terminal peptidase prc
LYPDFNGLDWESVKEEYNQKISAGLSNAELNAQLSDLIFSLGDQHSYYLNPQEVAAQDAEYEGKHDYVGIGIYVSAVPERQRAVILTVFPDSPAQAAGLRPRDSLLSVDGTPILDEDGFLRDIVRGPDGTSIDIVVQTPGEELRQLNITRQRITSTFSVENQVITTTEGLRIGYIFLVTFMDGTVDEQVENAIKEMTLDGPLDGLILDNRMNEGGSSLVLKPMLGYFSGGTLGYFVRRSDKTPLSIRREDINGSLKVPLVVLVGSGTASFGEIFSGILQDTGRAHLIGTTTDGNVEILWGYDFEDGSELWLANETFLPINHSEQDWEQTGIIPDQIVQGEFDEYTVQTDPLILAAIQYFSQQ